MTPDEIKQWLTKKEYRLYGVHKQRDWVLETLAQFRADFARDSIPKPECVRTWHDNGSRYETACGHDADHYNEAECFKFCPYCGGKIREAK